MSYWIYKQFGRCITNKEIDASIKKWTSPWYLKPYYSFIEWNEKRKRYNSAEIKLKNDSPYNSCLMNLIFSIIGITIISVISIFFIFIIKGCS